MRTILTSLLFFVFSNSFAQPISPYKEEGYSKEEIKAFALANTEISKNWRASLLEYLNRELQKAGDSLVLNSKHIAWIMDQTVHQNKTLSSFTNSRKVGEKVEFFTAKKSWTGEVGIFKYGGLQIVIYKTMCKNLLRDVVLTGDNGQNGGDLKGSQEVPEGLGNLGNNGARAGCNHPNPCGCDHGCGEPKCDNSHNVCNHPFDCNCNHKNCGRCAYYKSLAPVLPARAPGDRHWTYVMQ